MKHFNHFYLITAIILLNACEVKTQITRQVIKKSDITFSRKYIKNTNLDSMILGYSQDICNGFKINEIEKSLYSREIRVTYTDAFHYWFFREEFEKDSIVSTLSEWGFKQNKDTVVFINGSVVKLNGIYSNNKLLDLDNISEYLIKENCDGNKLYLDGDVQFLIEIKDKGVIKRILISGRCLLQNNDTKILAIRKLITSLEKNYHFKFGHYFQEVENNNEFQLK